MLLCSARHRQLNDFVIQEGRARFKTMSHAGSVHLYENVLRQIDKRIGVQLGTTGDLYVSEMMPGATIDRYNNGIDAVQDLVSGRLDAVVIDEAPAGVFVAQAPGLIILPDRLSDEVYSIALPLGQDELCAKMNAALAELKADGTLAEIVASHQSES